MPLPAHLPLQVTIRGVVSLSLYMCAKAPIGRNTVHMRDCLLTLFFRLYTNAEACQTGYAMTPSRVLGWLVMDND